MKQLNLNIHKLISLLGTVPEGVVLSWRVCEQPRLYQHSWQLLSTFQTWTELSLMLPLHLPQRSPGEREDGLVGHSVYTSNKTQMILYWSPFTSLWSCTILHQLERTQRCLPSPWQQLDHHCWEGQLSPHELPTKTKVQKKHHIQIL